MEKDRSYPAGTWLERGADMRPISFSAEMNVLAHFLGHELVPWRPQEPRTYLPFREFKLTWHTVAIMDVASQGTRS